ncbi:hypothetical protein O6H91_21G059300 [Diphasiastrum complanatum]|uniref:Uncharacterized protein n=1 Tax=Diphasiastrum complanatum TaxID=34168 RepID=A0ACC2AL66_DIPCM|nr:hypothetical protein O6H91_21G059300 [Diphasiastrum complanatum]
MADDDPHARAHAYSSQMGGGVLARAREALKQGQYSDAVRACKQLLKQDRSNDEAYVVLGLALLASGQHLDQAEMSFRRATALNPSSLSAWRQGLVDYCEVIGDSVKLIEASGQAAKIAQSAGDHGQYEEFMRKLAFGYAATSKHLEAQAMWQELRTSPFTSEAVKLEAIRGLVDSGAALMEERIQEDYKLRIGQIDASKDHLSSLHNEVTYREAEMAWAGGESCKVLVSQLEEIINYYPFSQHFHILLLSLLRRRLLAESASSGQELKTAKIKLFQHSVATLFLCQSKTAMEVAFAMIEEDDLDALFLDLQMEHLRQLKHDRRACLLWLGTHIAHIYPQNRFSFAAIAVALAQSSSLDGKRFAYDQASLMEGNSISGWKFLAEVKVSDGAFESAVDFIRHGLQAIVCLRHTYGLSLKTAELQLRMLLAHTLHLRNCHTEAKECFQQLAQDAEKFPGKEGPVIAASALEGMAKIAVAEGNWEEGISRLKAVLSYDGDNHWALAELGWLEFQKGIFSQARVKLEKAVTLCPNIAIYHYKLGLLYWKAGEDSQLSKERALGCLLRAAQLNPSQTDVFHHLGHLYRDVGDVRRAIRCYQKAISLNAEDEEAGEALCDALHSGAQDVLLTAICREASQKSAHAFWAWRHLGFLQVCQKDWSEAVVSLQYALRGYPKDAELWEALGLAYQQLGMLTASLKAYGRVLVLGSSSTLFSMLQSGNILLSLALYQKAIDTFRTTLESVPNLLGAKYGLAASLLGRARECVGQAAYGWGAKLLEEASELASRCAHDFGTLIGAWKLLGDIEVEYAQALPCELWGVEDGDISMQPKVVGAIVNSWYERRTNAAKHAVQAYQHALHLDPSQAVLYADLGIAFKLLYSINRAGRGSPFSRCHADTVICGGLHLDPVNPNIWATFGMLNEHRGMQQHAYIQALRLDGNHAVSWAELGQLYVKEGDDDLAKQSFERARAANPKLALPWAGMSVIHSLKDRNLDLEEAFASCLYAVTLSPLVEYRLGLAKAAAETKQLHLSQVYASIHQAVLHSPDQLEALNLLGLACESRGLMETAIRSFHLAHVMLTEFEDGKSLTRSYKDVAVSLNLARAFLKSGNTIAAVREYRKLDSTGNLQNEPEGQQCFALSLWKSGHHEEGLKIAKQAVKAATLGTKHHAAAVRLVCQFLYHLSGSASTLEEIWKLPREVFSDKSFGYTAMAITIATDRDDLLHQVLQKCTVLLEMENAPKTHTLLAAGKQFTQSQYESQDKSGACNRKSEATLSCLVKALHLYPHSLLLRSQLAKSLLSFSKGFKASLAARCSLSCVLRKAEDTQDDVLYSTLADAALACSPCSGMQPILTISTCSSDGEYHISVLQMLRRWLHREPWNLMAKYSVILTLMQQAREQRFPSQLCESIVRMSDTAIAMLPLNKQGNPFLSYMHVQLLLCASECSLHSEDHAKAIELAVTASRLKVNPSNISYAFLQLARCYGLRQDHSAQEFELKNWQMHSSRDDVLGQLLMADLQLKNVSKSQKCAITAIRKHAILEKNHEENFVWLALLQLVLAHAFIQAGDLSAAEIAATEASKLWPENLALHLFHGSICMELAKLGFAVEYVSSAISSLQKVSHGKHGVMPIANALLAKAHASKAPSTSTGLARWESYVRKEWAVWPPDLRPAEIYFQMGLLARQANGSSQSNAECPEICETVRSWMQKAVHMNPACDRYWVIVGQMKEQSTANHTALETPT